MENILLSYNNKTTRKQKTLGLYFKNPKKTPLLLRERRLRIFRRTDLAVVVRYRCACAPVLTCIGCCFLAILIGCVFGAAIFIGGGGGFVFSVVSCDV